MSRDVFRLDEVSKALQLSGSAGGISGLLQRETKFCMTGFGFLDGMISRSLHPLTDVLRVYSFIGLETRGENQNSQEHGYLPLASPLMCESWYGLRAL